jgi:hypothetical protein
MSKFLRIEHEDGTTWEVPAKVVAHDRAEHYADKETTSTGGETYDTTIEEEMCFALDDEYALVDWAGNNMRWEELEPHATKITTAESPPRRMTTADLSVVSGT